MKRKINLMLLCGIVLLGVCGCSNSITTTNSENTANGERTQTNKIDDNTLQTIKNQVLNMENVKSAKLSVNGRIINITVDYNENTTSEYKQSNGLDILNLFDSNIIDYYDFTFNSYNCVGAKNVKNDNIIWIDCD